MRKFETGATRDDAENKLHYWGYLSPYAMRGFAEYMSKHEVQADGKRREPGNWKQGIPIEAYQDSGFRHMMTWKEQIESGDNASAIETAYAILFNVQGWLHEQLKPDLRYGYNGQTEADNDWDITGELLAGSTLGTVGGTDPLRAERTPQAGEEPAPSIPVKSAMTGEVTELRVIDRVVADAFKPSKVTYVEPEGRAQRWDPDAEADKVKANGKRTAFDLKAGNMK